MTDDARDIQETPEKRALRERERKHFVFASILILGTVLLLPASGAVYVLLMKFGIVASPF